MLQKLREYKIKKRLVASSNLTIVSISTGTILMLISMTIALIIYGNVLDNYALPQGDIGHAMASLNAMRSATIGIVGYDDYTEVEKFGNEYAESKKEFEDYITIVYGTIVTDVGREDFDNIISSYDAYCKTVKNILLLGSDPTNLEARKEAQTLLNGEAQKQFQIAYDSLQDLMDTNAELAQKERDNSRMAITITVFLVAGVAISALVTSNRRNNFVTESIIEPLKELQDRLAKFREGDLSSPFPKYEYDDEIGDIINISKQMAERLTNVIEDLKYLYGQMAEGNFDIATKCENEYVNDLNPLLLAARQMNNNISNTLYSIKEASDMVSSGSANLSDASQGLAEGATEQAAAVEELLATIDEITSGLKETANDLNGSKSQAELCFKEAENSKVEMTKLIEAMGKIQETSNQISKIIDDIEEIASQTNLLSLNASIEAARAGEAGRGFAVVAGQIGKLADDSKRSAKNTRQLIESSISDINIGSKYVESTSEVLVHVSSLVEEIAQNTGAITQKSQSQAYAAEQVKEGCSRIAEIVSNNSATAEETSATSQELSAQAISLDELVGMFRLRSK